MRGGRALLLSLLVLAPLVSAIPLPVADMRAFTYEPIEEVGTGVGPSRISTCTDGTSVGFGLMSPSGNRFVVRSPVARTTVYYPPSSLATLACVFDSMGRFHGLYSDGTRTSLRSVTFENGVWTDRLVDEGALVQAVQGASSNGSSYFMAYYNPDNQVINRGRPYFYKLDPVQDAWVRHDASFPRLTWLGALSFDVGAHGEFHVIYVPSNHDPNYDRTDVWLHAYGALGDWTIQRPPFGTEGEWGASLTLGPNDLPYFAYSDSQRRPHLVAPLGPGGSYVDERIMQGSHWNEGAGRHPHLRVADDGTVHAISRWATLNYDLPAQNYYYHHQRNGPGDWTTTPLYPVANQWDAWLELDACGEPVIGISHGGTPVPGSHPQYEEIGTTILARPVDARVGC